MKITNIKASNFRNLKSVDVKFKDINILTGKNSTGKTNFTQLLTNCLNIDPNIESYFGKNIVTHGPGLNQTTIETTIHDNFAIFNSEDGFLFIKDFKITYKHLIKKDISYSKNQSLINYSGKEVIYDNVQEFIKVKKIEEGKFESRPEVYEKSFDFIEGSNNKLGIDGPISDIKNNINKGRYFEIFKNETQNGIINFDNGKSFSNCGYEIFNKVIEKNKEKGLQAVDYIKNKENIPGFSSFKIAKFISLLADIQKYEKNFKEFKEDLFEYTDGILTDVYINLDGKKGTGSKGDISISSPHGPTDIEFISAGTALILYFVVLKNWLKLETKSYQKPDIMIFDELDSAIHPSLINKFSGLLNYISKDVQLFITTHSVTFIDQFKRENIYLLKDMGSFNDKVQVESNIKSYKEIMDYSIQSLSEEEIKEFEKMPNSKLYIEGFIDIFFPTI